jgi:hypothetical protein
MASIFLEQSKGKNFVFWIIRKSSLTFMLLLNKEVCDNVNAHEFSFLCRMVRIVLFPYSLLAGVLEMYYEIGNSYSFTVDNRLTDSVTLSAIV